MKTALKSTNLDNELMFTLKKVNSIRMEAFEEFFADLPLDPYIKGKYRTRRWSRFLLSGEELIKLPRGSFYQSKNYNPLLGGAKREYAELSDRLMALNDFKQLIGGV